MKKYDPDMHSPCSCDPELKSHIEPDFELFECPKCYYRVIVSKEYIDYEKKYKEQIKRTKDLAEEFNEQLVRLSNEVPGVFEWLQKYWKNLFLHLYWKKDKGRIE